MENEYQYILFDNHEDFKTIVLKFISQDVDFFSFSFKKEKSLICSSDQLISDALKVENGWIGFKIEGQMPFGTVEGLIATISSCLFQQKIGICLVSTFDTDLFLIKKEKAQQAKEILTEAGWSFV
jgi:hypothetical protein